MSAGPLRPCCAPDAQRRTLGEFGDLNHACIHEVWNGDAYRRLLELLRSPALPRLQHAPAGGGGRADWPPTRVAP